MSTHDRLRELGLFDARVPRYTSYPPANHFRDTVGPETAASWIAAIPAKAKVSLYLHIPYCRRLCWFCACRTQGTATDRPLLPYLAYLKAELAIVGQYLAPDVQISQIHLGGGTPTLFSPDMIKDLGQALNRFRPLAPDLRFSVEIDPTEVDKARIDALVEIGMTRASIGVQDFDPVVQDAIGRAQSFAQTRDVVDHLRRAGIGSVNMDILYGLPYQTKSRLTDSVQRVLSLNPDRVALYGYAHVPWMAKRQVMIPADALPGPETRLGLFETASRLFVWDGYQEVGIDHYARADDSLAIAARNGGLRRNFQGYTDDVPDALIGMGASAISRFPQGYTQNQSISSRYASAIENGSLATERGHAMTADDRLRADMIERLMCRFELDLAEIARVHETSVDALLAITAGLRDHFSEYLVSQGNVIRLTDASRLIARLAAQFLDTYHMPEGRHSRAL
jgi:oxygen-independent coproporphyrinogen III oxidase